ncbi:polyprenyl synthetase family protein [Microbacterium sp. H1-D42]|uniref:polyprenyl synthetase family protein n=1 Tax=Microbacterium sp. H1-D42 TaxID=2925844 RepID=UPI001F53C5F3|nr:polyprenyl synthetase family protein [Microbacterium sp. H1-D42]UNK72610.1 polyprenyl synthetase family protein [Microbacterium sp. H1-D42]
MSETAVDVADAAVFDDAALVEERMLELLSQRTQRSRAFAPAYAQLWQAVERMAAGGKKVRPRMLMRAYHALGGTDTRTAVDAACAVELLHLALVIHDDVIDKDLLRRGELNISGQFAVEVMVRGATRHEASAWGEASSLLAGDLLLSLAQSLLARLDLPQQRRLAVLDLFDETLFESAAGEHHDVWLSMHLEASSPTDVLAMLDQKTAAYSFRAPLVLAAILAGSEPSIIAELTTIARQIGVIYQLRDDILGLFGDERATGKSTLSDLREGKETLLIAYARSDPSWQGVEALFGDRELSIMEAPELRRVIEQSGGLAFVESVIADRCRHVHDLIGSAALPPAVKDQLTELTTACSARDS